MFDLAQKRIVWIPITWRGLVQKDEDALAEATDFQIEVKAEILDEDAIRETFSPAPTDDMDEEARKVAEKSAQLTNVEKFRRVVSGWRGVKNGVQDLAFTDENIALMLKLPNFQLGFETSYLMAWAGRIALAEKNSGSSSDSGQQGAGEQGAKKTTPRSRKKQNS